VEKEEFFDEDHDEGNQYYDSDEIDEDGGLSPINLPQEDLQEDDDLAQEKIYNICSSGKKT
jgi:hypothetical protein